MGRTVKRLLPGTLVGLLCLLNVALLAACSEPAPHSAAYVHASSNLHTATDVHAISRWYTDQQPNPSVVFIRHTAADVYATSYRHTGQHSNNCTNSHAPTG